MRSVFGDYFVAPAKIVNAGRLNAAVIECERGDAEFFDVYFRGNDGAVEHVKSFKSRRLADEIAAALNLNRGTA